MDVDLGLDPLRIVLHSYSIQYDVRDTVQISVSISIPDPKDVCNLTVTGVGMYRT